MIYRAICRFGGFENISEWSEYKPELRFWVQNPENLAVGAKMPEPDAPVKLAGLELRFLPIDQRQVSEEVVIVRYDLLSLDMRDRLNA